MDYSAALKNFTPSKDYFAGIDSDGCAFPTMELKHKNCFVPNFIKFFGLEKVSRFARETWEFVNLYSLDRGVNRFPALVKSIELLIRRPEFAQSGIPAPDLKDIRAFVFSGKPQSNSGLKEFMKEHESPSLKNLLAWSEAVNADVELKVKNVGPFPSVLKSLKKLFPLADIMVISGTPVEALEREWKEHGISGFAKLICGQEMGTKKEHLSVAAKGKYAPGKILMIGDAPGDHKAAVANDALFFPVDPGSEERSWALLAGEGLDRFFEGTYKGTFEDDLIAKFYALLPEKPAWE